MCGAGGHPTIPPEGRAAERPGLYGRGTCRWSRRNLRAPRSARCCAIGSGVRRKSQLELASEAMTTPRYVSFVETGRAQPSRQMVVRLARALDVPLRERNGLLLAAGYAPMYSVGSLDAPELGRVDAALTAMLEHHEPFPAVVMDRGWTVVRANARRNVALHSAPRAGDHPRTGQRSATHDRVRSRATSAS